MISCTEFIPAYSELFTFLADTYGRGEVARLWDYLFQPDGKGIPLVNFVKEHGIRGCWEYWSGTLTEEACDCTMYLNEKAGWFLIKMHRCPSKGRLLDLEKSAGIRPYPEYCLHCDHYRSAVESVGLKYLYNFTGTERASCSMLIYDPGVFDGRVIADENTQKREIRSADLEYFHPDFHSSLNMGIEYLGSRHGEKAVEQYLQQYSRRVYAKLIESIRAEGLPALMAHLEKTYEAEHAPDALSMRLEGNALFVDIHYCPGVRHLQKTGRQVSRWYPWTTKTVMETIAKAAGLKFEMAEYSEETGACVYSFRA
ncbi:MAG TPA: hypothetical protein IAA84_09215 [Candidatus Alectryocaccomicrobium excrementavium]|uniref:Uncharacterized protein n=1 Tax=Candidatus Alectryocaccomicrobium excrementavium TaxID=2840668 RepID=A0A9D1K651_9FIRM|nr:hypothetical protein [Candidatus Alectryocaccomicrobium excrementavium]